MAGLIRYEITSVSRYTPEGMTGVWFFVGGPFITGAGYGWMLYQLRTYAPQIIVPALVIAIGSLLFLLGAAMMLTGRSTVHHVRAVEAPQEPNQDW